MLTKKTIVIIIIVVIVIGLAVALLLVDKSFFAPKQEQPVNQEPITGQENNLPSPEKGLAPVEPAVTLTPLEQNLTVIARNFAERYGSFSTDSQFLNLKELKDFSTPKLQSELEAVITNEAAKEFYGVSSRAMKVEILDSSENAATVLVSLQREESRAGQDNFVYYQDLKLSLVKSGENWLIDEVQWQE